MTRAATMQKRSAGSREFFLKELELLESDQVSEMLELWASKGKAFNIVALEREAEARLDELIVHIQDSDAWFTGDPDQLLELLNEEPL